MVNRKVIVRLRDILAAIDGALDVIDGVDFASYRESFITRKAMERCVEIVSEASRQIPDEMKARFPEVPWPEIRAIGNVIRHDYDRVDDIVIWRIATKSFGELRPIIYTLLVEAERDNT